MKYKISFVYYLLISIQIYGQGDSLMLAYSTFDGTEHEEYLQLKEIIRNTVDVNMDTAMHYYYILDSIANQTTDSTIIMETKFLGGAIYIIDYKPEKAKPLILDYIDYCTRRNDETNLAKSHRFIAATYTLLTDYDKAIYHALRAQEYISYDKYVIQFNNRARIARSYVQMDEREKAIESWHWYLNNIEASTDNYNTRVYTFISELYLDLNKLDSASHYVNISSRMANDLNMTAFVQKGNIIKAEIELINGNKNKAKALAEQAYDLFKDYPESFDAYLKVHKIMAKLAQDDNNYTKAKRLLIDGLATAKARKRTNDEIFFTKSLLNLELDQKTNLRAKGLLDSFQVLNKRLAEESKKQALYTIHRQYDLEKKEIEIDLLRANNELAVANSTKAKRNTLFALLGTLALALISFLLYRSLVIKKKSEQVLTEKNNIISEALSEKELLLKEIHHRVKNNLQVVSSLLSLQSEYIKDDSALSAINEGRNRVRSMALIHQNLYSEKSLTGINVKSYLEKLIKGLFESYNINEDQIKLSLDISDLELDVDIVVPLGLIANELVSNALKHAFNDQEEGMITVRLNRSDDKLVFCVEDNGSGMNIDQDLEELDSFGYQMISAFRDKLGAELILKNVDGLQVKLIIKEE